MSIMWAFNFVATTISIIYGDGVIRSDNGILILTKSNFRQAVTDNEFILVKFYSPGCPHCRAMNPEYVKAAQILANRAPGIKLGQVNGVQEKELADENEVMGYPTLKFFVKGDPDENYNGGRYADAIVTWLMKKTGLLK